MAVVYSCPYCAYPICEYTLICIIHIPTNAHDHKFTMLANPYGTGMDFAACGVS